MEIDSFDVFVSHAGTEKRDVVSRLVGALRRKGLKVFVDFEMALGTYAPTATEEAAHTARVGLFVLSPDFLAGDWPMKELRIFLERADSGSNQKVRLVPYFFSVKAWDDNPSLPLDQKQLLDQVSEYTGLERFPNDYEHEQVEKLAEAVFTLVNEIRALPSDTKTTAIVSINVPEPVGWFAGREGDVNEIVELIKNQLDNFEGRLLRVAIVGAPGMGKSQLALKAVDKLLGTFGVHARLDASDETTLRNGFFALAQQLRVDWDESHPKESEDRVLRCLFELDGPWLLILDNVKPDVEFAKEMSKRFAGRPKVASAIIVTSQFETFDNFEEPWKVVKLDQLNDGLAVEILKSRVCHEYKEDTLLKNVESELHGLPLALSVAGGHMHEYHMSPEDYLKEMQRNINPGRDAATSAVRLSIERLGDDAKNILRILSLLSPNDIPQSLIQAIFTKFDRKDLAQLHSVLLITWKADKIAIHQLVQQAARMILPADESVFEQLVNVLVNQAVERETGLQETSRRAALVPHIQAVLQHTSSHESENLQLLRARVHATVGIILQATSQYNASLEQHQAALDIRLRLLGQSAISAESHSSIGRVYFDLGKYDLALGEHQKALDIRDTTLGKDNPKIAETYNDIGRALLWQNNYQLALNFYERALKILEGQPDTSDKGTTYNGIANAYSDQGDYTKALEYYNKALAIREKVLGKEHPDTATSYNNIANAYSDQGDYTKALEYYNKALAIREKVLGKEHPDTAGSYSNIGSVYYDKGDYPRALEYYNKALAIREKLHGKEHPDTASSYLGIGNVYQAQGDYPRALEYHNKALAINEKILGKEHPDTAGSYNNIAMVYKAQGDYPRALEYHNKALAIREKVLGKEHPDTATSYNNIANVYDNQGDYPRALEYHNKALAINEKVLGKEHPDTARSYYNIGLVYYAQDDYPRALEYNNKALAIYEKTPGKEHKDTADTCYNIALAYNSLGNKAKAVRFMERARTAYSSVYGEDHSYTKDAAAKLAEWKKQSARNR